MSLTARILTYLVGLLLSWLFAWRISSVQGRQALFLAVSYILYASWGSWFVGVLLMSSLMNYALGKYVRRHPSAQRLWLGIVCNVVLLGFFKYLPGAGHAVFHHSAIAAVSRIVMPIGMSFWTFQALSYLLDLYREEDLDPSLLEFCLYMAFWPTVLSGPICRLPQLLPQFRQHWAPAWNDVANGVQRICIGMLMTSVARVLRDGLLPGHGVDAAFAQTAAYLGGLDVWILIISYGFELFLEFCGYSHLVIGAARIFGFRLQENFDRPYLSTTPSMFWTRWHMSLSFWIRDYVFFPLATLRPERWWRNLSLVIAMFIFGLWHRGSILFMLWGAYQGVLLVMHRLYQQSSVRWNLRLPGYLLTPLSWAVTFAAVSVGWIFFRADTFTQAVVMLRAIVTPADYFHISLPASLCWVTLLVGMGYFLVVLGGRILDHWASGEATYPVDDRDRVSHSMMILARNRWVWVAPVVVVLTFYFFVLFHRQVTSVAPMLYRF